jgi:hypothetical protein
MWSGYKFWAACFDIITIFKLTRRTLLRQIKNDGEVTKPERDGQNMLSKMSRRPNAGSRKNKYLQSVGLFLIHLGLDALSASPDDERRSSLESVYIICLYTKCESGNYCSPD